MKTLIAACIIILLSLQVNYSQFISNIGVKAGMTFSNQDYIDSSGNQWYGFDNTFGFNGSVFTEFLSTKNFNLIAEAGYEQRGFSFEYLKTDEFGNPIEMVTQHHRTDYITAGLSAKLKFPGKYISSYYTLGPRADYYLGFKLHSSDNNSLDTVTQYWPLENFKKYNYSITIGAGLELSFVKRFRPFIEANYSPRIAESYNHRGFNVKEHYFNIKAGIYIFDFGKRK